MKFVCLLLCFALFSCAPASQKESPPAPTEAVSPAIPARLERDETGQPLLRVYIKKEAIAAKMPVETYLYGVVAGEMRSDWPAEALRAQAILARAFVLKFVSEKESMYPDADISTDIAEAQAYDEAAIDARIRAAVDSTRGMVLATAGGQLPYAWFHAHSGGTTALAREALGWNKAEPAWTKVAPGLDSPDAPPEAADWEASFTEEEFLAACRQNGTNPNTINGLAVGEKGESGRAVTLIVDGEAVNAASLRLALGSTVMRSTLLTELRAENGMVYMAGKGYGHGVGMPQWGAYALAQAGKKGEDIALHWFNGLHIATLW